MPEPEATTRRELLDELDSLSAALENAWQEVAPGEDPHIPVLSEVVEDVSALFDDASRSPAAQPQPVPPVVHEDACAVLIEEVLARWLPLIEADLRERLQGLLPRVAQESTDPGTALPGTDAPT